MSSSRIEKLLIQGIRSFGPSDEDRSTIDFISSPLTLILGQNGCGKTTIIECLRYITTGDCPPGSYGGRSFVHDPKMARENKVNGHVKLQFRGIDGQIYIISRTIEATQKAKQIQIKTLDTLITRKGPNGENTSIGGKCADTNSAMTIHLGVSKAILNYVIFCHQEDSNWPLDEGSKVKDKFDEIFASAKYKDCLKKIKEIRLKHQESLRGDKVEIQYLKSDKESLDSKKSDLSFKENQRRILEDSLSDLENQIFPLTKEISELHKAQENFQDIMKNCSAAEASLNHCKIEAEDLKGSLEKLLSERELKELKVNVDSDFESQNESKGSYEKSLRALEMDYKAKEYEMKRLLATIGECRSHQKMNEGVMEDVKELAEKNLKIFSYDDEADVLSEAEKLVSRIKETLKSKSEDYDDEIKKERQFLHELAIQKAKRDEQKLSKQNEVIKCKREFALLTKECSKETIWTSRQDLKERGRVAKKALEDLEASKALKILKSQLEERKKKKGELLLRETQIKAEKKTVEKSKEIFDELESKKTEVKSKTKLLNKILFQRKSELKEIFSSLPQNESLKERFNEEVESLSAEMKKVDENMSHLSSTLNSIHYSKTQLTGEISKMKSRITDFQVKSRGEDVEALLLLTKKNVKEARYDLQVKEANKFTYAEFIERMKDGGDNTCCPTCSRAFQKQSEAFELIVDLEKEIKRIPNKVKSLKNKLESYEKKYNALTSLMPEKKQCDELEFEIQRKSQELEELEKSLQNTEFENVKERKESLEMKNSLLNELREDVYNIDRTNSEISSLKKSICDLELSYKEKTFGKKDFGLLREEEKVNTEELETLSKDIETLQEREISHGQRVIELEKEVNEVFRIEMAQAERQSKLDSKKDLEVTIFKLTEELKSLQSSELQCEIQERELKRDSLIQQKNSEMETLQTELYKAQRVETELRHKLKLIDDYRQGNYEAQLLELKDVHEKLTRDKKHIESSMKEIGDEILKISSFLSNISSRKRLIDDNVKYHAYTHKIKEFEDIVTKYTRELKNSNAEDLRRKEQELMESRDKLDGIRHNKKGRLTEIKNVIREIERELSSKKYQEAEEKFRQKDLMIRCREFVIGDLNKYYIALDWAIMKFHKERMAVINKIIREFWRATYKGNDIDYIEIQTDDVDISAGADKRRNYNYRVVMVKNDTVLEMRGRCSAGQKVLASLIIRLALAETFSANCGIIALDEPTTNLDRENIQSLAEALARIVLERSQRGQFQLIVITHDEDLIDQLGRVERVDRYYKVSRNENGLSKIRKFDITAH